MDPLTHVWMYITHTHINVHVYISQYDDNDNDASPFPLHSSLLSSPHLPRPGKRARVRGDVKHQEEVEDEVGEGAQAGGGVHGDGQHAVEGAEEEELEGDPDGLFLWGVLSEGGGAVGKGGWGGDNTDRQRGYGWMDG